MSCFYFNQHKYTQIFIYIVAIWGSSAKVTSQELTYPSPDTVIATWAAEQKKPPNAAEALALFDQMNRLNAKPNTMLRIQRALEDAGDSGQLSVDFLFLKARLQQLKHEFEAAAETLETVIKADPRYTAAHLTLANVHINQAQFDQAMTQCERLMTLTSHIIALTCILDAQFQKLPREETYQKLKKVVRLNQSSGGDEQRWMAEILASMALALNKPEQAADHLKTVDLKDAPVSLVALWADIQLALKQPNRVLQTIPALLHNQENLDDALLLRLAEAEKSASQQQRWQERMAQRVSLRRWREDTEHAAQLARYFLDVEENQELALHFAKLNYQHAKGHADRVLLARAQKGADSRVYPLVEERQ